MQIHIRGYRRPEIGGNTPGLCNACCCCRERRRYIFRRRTDISHRTRAIYTSSNSKSARWHSPESVHHIASRRVYYIHTRILHLSCIYTYEYPSMSTIIYTYIQNYSFPHRRYSLVVLTEGKSMTFSFSLTYVLRLCTILHFLLANYHIYFAISVCLSKYYFTLHKNPIP